MLEWREITTAPKSEQYFSDPFAPDGDSVALLALGMGVDGAFREPYILLDVHLVIQEFSLLIDRYRHAGWLTFACRTVSEIGGQSVWPVADDGSSYDTLRSPAAARRGGAKRRCDCPKLNRMCTSRQTVHSYDPIDDGDRGAAGVTSVR